MSDKKSEKDTGKAKRVIRTQKEIAIEKASKLVEKANDLMEMSRNLKKRINGLPSGEFSAIAKGFNNVMDSLSVEFESAKFETTDKPSDEPSESSMSFEDYMKAE